MKLLVGKRKVDESAFTKALQAEVYKAQVATSINSSKQLVRRVAKIALDAALDEAFQIFPTIVRIIDRYRAPLGISYSDLMEGVRLAQGFNAPSGSVEWSDWTFDYARRKIRSFPYGTARFFNETGQLRNYFITYGSSVITGNFGGIKVEADTSQLTPDLISGPEIDRFLLSRVKVHIFPKIAPSLLPMLSSGYWTDVFNDGAFERTMLSPRSGVKLENHQEHYRPLVLPVVQFWIQVRIPNAVALRLKEFFRKSQVFAR